MDSSQKNSQKEEAQPTDAPELILGVVDPDRYVYHYTPAATALEHILPHRQLRFGRYTNTNDPKESRTWSFSTWAARAEDLAAYDLTETSRWLSDELKSKARLACFATDQGPLTGDHIRDIYNRGWARSRMWAQYAGNHSGVCLVFDRKKLGALIQARFGGDCDVASGPVSYFDRSVFPRMDEQEYLINTDFLRKVGKEEYVRWHLQAHHERLFLEKLMDWRDEREFRWVLFSGSEEDLLLDLEDALVGIMFGDRASDEDIDRAISLTAGSGLSYAGLRWKNCSPWYDLMNWRYMPDGPWKETMRRAQTKVRE